MEEFWVRGVIIGVTLGLIGFGLDLIWKLIKSKTEAARRLKLVIKAAFAILAWVFMLTNAGLVPALITAAVIAALVWVYRGRNQKN